MFAARYQTTDDMCAQVDLTNRTTTLLPFPVKLVSTLGMFVIDERDRLYYTSTEDGPRLVISNDVSIIRKDKVSELIDLSYPEDDYNILLVLYLDGVLDVIRLEQERVANVVTIDIDTPIIKIFPYMYYDRELEGEQDNYCHIMCQTGDSELRIFTVNILQGTFTTQIFSFPSNIKYAYSMYYLHTECTLYVIDEEDNFWIRGTVIRPGRNFIALDEHHNNFNKYRLRLPEDRKIKLVNAEWASATVLFVLDDGSVFYLPFQEELEGFVRPFDLYQIPRLSNIENIFLNYNKYLCRDHQGILHVISINSNGGIEDNEQNRTPEINYYSVENLQTCKQAPGYAILNRFSKTKKAIA